MYPRVVHHAREKWGAVGSARYRSQLAYMQALQQLVRRKRAKLVLIGDTLHLPDSAARCIPSTFAPSAGERCVQSAAGVEFDAIDGRPAHILVAVLGPERQTGEHLKALARFSKLLRNGVALFEGGESARADGGRGDGAGGDGAHGSARGAAAEGAAAEGAAATWRRGLFEAIGRDADLARREDVHDADGGGGGAESEDGRRLRRQAVRRESIVGVRQQRRRRAGERRRPGARRGGDAPGAAAGRDPD